MDISKIKDLLQLFHPVFIASYLILLISLISIFRTSYINSDNVNPFLSGICILSLIVSVIKFPRSLGETIMAFAIYISLVSLPASFLVLIASKTIGEFVVGARDFMKVSKRDLFLEIEDHIEALISIGRYEDAIEYLRKTMPKCPNDYRFNNEIAKIAIIHLKDFRTALDELEKVIQKSKDKENQVFTLFRMVDICLGNMNDKNKAESYLERIINKFPNSESSRNAKIRLEFLKTENESQKESPMNQHLLGRRNTATTAKDMTSDVEFSLERLNMLNNDSDNPENAEKI